MAPASRRGGNKRIAPAKALRGMKKRYTRVWSDPKNLSESAAVPGTPAFKWARRQILLARQSLPERRRGNPVYLDLAAGKALASSTIAADLGFRRLHTLDLASVRPLRPPEGSRLRISHVQGDVQALPYRGGFADIVSSFMGWDMAPDITKATRELRRVMRPNARAVIMLHRFEGVGHVEKGLEELRDIGRGH